MSGEIAGKELDAASVQGQDIAINATGSDVMVGEAKVLQAHNGVIHVIDTVILAKM